jgi:hypothetical protein
MLSPFRLVRNSEIPIKITLASAALLTLILTLLDSTIELLLSQTTVQLNTANINMQLTTITALLAAALTVGASPLEARQGVPRVRATFYNNGGYCGPPEQWKEDTVFVQDTVGVCHNLDVGPFQATYFNESSVTHTRKSKTNSVNLD